MSIFITIMRYDIPIISILRRQICNLAFVTKLRSLNTTVGSSHWISASNSNRCHFDSQLIGINYAFATTKLRSLNTANSTDSSGVPPLWSQIRNPRITDITSQHYPALKQKLQSSNQTLLSDSSRIRSSIIWKFNLFLRGEIFITKSNLQPSNTNIRFAACFLHATKLRSLNTDTFRIKITIFN